MFTESTFKKILISDFVLLGVADEDTEDGFAIVGIHLKVLVGERSPQMPRSRMRRDGSSCVV